MQVGGRIERAEAVQAFVVIEPALLDLAQRIPGFAWGAPSGLAPASRRRSATPASLPRRGQGVVDELALLVAR